RTAPPAFLLTPLSTPGIPSLSLHDALPIYPVGAVPVLAQHLRERGRLGRELVRLRGADPEPGGGGEHLPPREDAGPARRTDRAGHPALAGMPGKARAPGGPGVQMQGATRRARDPEHVVAVIVGQ